MARKKMLVEPGDFEDIDMNNDADDPGQCPHPYSLDWDIVRGGTVVASQAENPAGWFIETISDGVYRLTAPEDATVDLGYKLRILGNPCYSKGFGVTIIPLIGGHKAASKGGNKAASKAGGQSSRKTATKASGKSSSKGGSKGSSKARRK